MTSQIDLDALDQTVADCEKWPHDWYDGGGAPSPEIVAALVRAVRAAKRYREAHEGYMCDGPDGQCEWRCKDAVELAAALAPFKAADG